MIQIYFDPFVKDSEEDTFRKIFEELYEVTDARTLNDCTQIAPLNDDVKYKSKKRLETEIGDLLTAILNWAIRRGYDPQECIDLAQTKNEIRGYYDV